jgi:hypothetical protein
VPSASVRNFVSQQRRRSVGFLDADGSRWACFLVTFRVGAHRWKGHFLYRRGGGTSPREVRTADIFIERSEEEIDRKARGLGKPLLLALLQSSLEVEASLPTPLGGWLRELLRRDPGSLGREAGPPNGPDVDDAEAGQLRADYAAYRNDQLAHLIALIEPANFELVVDRILDGQPIDFRSRDRLQLAMIVLDRLESLLPLPPLDVWRADAEQHRIEHERYRHELHRGTLVS